MLCRRKLCMLFLVITSLTVRGQHLNFQRVMPPTPEVAAFGKNVDIPIGYSSGTPQIGIPIFEVKSGNISIPVSLSYNASGIRVEEAATWVGLGWNLSTGGTLTRSVRGLADDTEYGYINAASNRTVRYMDSLPINSSERSYIELLVPMEQKDFEPDIWTFSAGGYTGKFHWDQDSARFIMSPYQHAKIVANGNMNITAFTVTLPDGTIYYFGGETRFLETKTAGMTTSKYDHMAQSNVTDGPGYHTSWAINEVTDAIGRKIKFNYASVRDVAMEFGRGGETYLHAGTSQSNNWHMNATVFQQQFSKPILLSISGENGEIFFRRSSSTRQDVVNEGKSLDTITIKNHNGAELKSYLFTYDYTTSADSTSLWGVAVSYIQIARKRMWLKEVREGNLEQSLLLPPYKFTYIDIPLPDRLSSAQDYWGYYNGKDEVNGEYLMPRLPLYVSTDSLSSGYVVMPGRADRRIDSVKSQAGVLKLVQYPTGGTTRYEYEQNRVPNYFLNKGTGIEQPDMVDKTYTFTFLMSVDPPWPRYYSENLTITRPRTKVEIDPSFPSPCSTSPNPTNCPVAVYVKRLSDMSTVATINTTSSFYIYLAEGEYLIEAFFTGTTSDPIPVFNVKFTWSEAPEEYNFQSGGLRVKKIVSSDSTGNTVSRRLQYEMLGYPASSGYLTGYPVHVIALIDTSGLYRKQEMVSNSPIPLTTDGQTISYHRVTEYLDSTVTSLKIDYYYLVDLLAIPFGLVDGAPLRTREWMNNQLMRKTVYEKTNTGYRTLSEQEFIFEPYDQEIKLYGLHGERLRRYEITREWFLPDSSTTTTYAYENGQQTISTGSRTVYNNDRMAYKTKTVNSKGKITESKTWYPNDYNDVSGYNIQTLKNNYIIGIPVKQETSVNGKITGGSIIKYTPQGLPAAVYSYEKRTLEDTAAHNRGVVLESGYQLKTSVGYDIDYNVRQVNASNAPNTSYIWGHDINGFDGTKLHMLPVAVVQNADSSSIAYSSFESASKGEWSYTGTVYTDNTAPTGGSCYDVSGSMSKTVNSGGVYVISYWSKSGIYSVSGSVASKTGKTVDGWTYYEHKVTGVSTVTISGSGYIDEVRLYPESALMTTFSYKNGIGIASQCDVNNRITYYEYDGMGRLLRIRDQDKNILKAFDYKYQQNQ